MAINTLGEFEPVTPPAEVRATGERVAELEARIRDLTEGQAVVAPDPQPVAPKEPRPIAHLLARLAAVATIVLTGTAFWLSYDHLHTVASQNGLSGKAAWAWPATVDLFIVVGEVLMLRASLRGRGMDWWAVALAASGSLGSIALNVAGVGEHAAAMEYVVAAVPPVAALLAFGALMRQLHAALAVHTETAVDDSTADADDSPQSESPEAPDVVAAESPSEAGESPRPPADESQRDSSSPTRRESKPKSRPRNSKRRAGGATNVAAIGGIDAEIDALVALMRERGDAEAVKLSEAEEITGKSEATAARRLSAAREMYRKSA